MEESERQQHGPFTRSQGIHKVPRVVPPIGPVLARANHLLADEEIRIAIRCITVFLDDGQPHVFECVSYVTDIGMTELHDLWSKWIACGGDNLPLSYIGKPHMTRPNQVIKLFGG